MLDVSPAHEKLILEILDKLVPHSEVRVFGSRAVGSAKPYSDLDLVIMSNEPLGSVLSDLAEAFSESDLPYKVDVIDWAVTSPHFQDIIKSQAVTFKGSA
ncbi:MAG: nucleotidyltransferase family protein [Fimbriimonas sp.]